MAIEENNLILFDIFRYNYGKEGKKVNWAPWSCMRIIMENVGPGELKFHPAAFVLHSNTCLDWSFKASYQVEAHMGNLLFQTILHI